MEISFYVIVGDYEILITKFVILVILITSITVSTQLGAINNSLGQNAPAQPAFSNDSGNTTNGTTTNEPHEKGNYQNFSSDFRIMNDTEEWTRVSGIWNYSTDGYQGSIKETVDTPINIIVSPVNSNKSLEISTSFAINEIANQGFTYASLIYALQDPFNYRQAGINIHNGSVSVFANTITDNVTEDTFWSPVPNANQLLTIGNPIAMSLVLENNTKTLFVNGLEFPLSVISNNTDGKVGLGYGGMQSITFNDFKAQSITDLYESLRPNFVQPTDTLTILLDETSIPEDSYIPIYDSRPYKILDGHVAAKLPCNDESLSNVQIMAGNAPELRPIELEIIPELSDAGSMCLYHGNVNPGQGNTIYDLVVQNNSIDDVDFPSTSSITISIAKLDSDFD